MSAPRYKTTKWSGLDNFECLHCPFATLDRGLMIRHVRQRHPTPSESGQHEEHPLARIDFASDEAAEFAITGELLPQDFAAYTHTGKGGYTLADVKRISAARARSATADGITEATTEES